MASRLSLKYGLTALTAGLVTYSTLPVAFADSKKSIYDDEEEKHEAIAPVPGTAIPAHDPKPVEKQLTTEIVSGVKVRSHKVLEETIGSARKWLAVQTATAQGEVDEAFGKYLKAEKSVTSTVAELKSDKEDILPGGIYVLISALTGSILARNRTVVLRAAAPLAFGIGAFAYFLPQTFSNTRALTWKFEQKSPQLAEFHTKTQDGITNLVNDVYTVADDANKSLENGVRKTRELIAESTGLQISSNNSEKKN
ncbi:hypothetical protein TRVA0_024S01508 [Trichomonascus vanleenenianus]|uniref:Mic26p n=1 Tax=Trichomonascus vanleenenianus TaxID=2268995 RepID=UPI003EC9DF4B